MPEIQTFSPKSRPSFDPQNGWPVDCFPYKAMGITEATRFGKRNLIRTALIAGYILVVLVIAGLTRAGAGPQTSSGIEEETEMVPERMTELTVFGD